MSTMPDPYRGFRYPSDVINEAVWLYYCFSLSLREVELILAQRGVEVSYETIRQWSYRFGRDFANRLRRRRPRPGPPGSGSATCNASSLPGRPSAFSPPMAPSTSTSGRAATKCRLPSIGRHAPRPLRPGRRRRGSRGQPEGQPTITPTGIIFSQPTTCQCGAGRNGNAAYRRAQMFRCDDRFVVIK